MDICTCGLCCVLMFFPGLKLSTLEVRGASHEPDIIWARWDHVASYDYVERLLKQDSFQELIYGSNNDLFLKYSPRRRDTSPFDSRPDPGPDPQSSTWSKMIKARDGAESGAEARLYRLTKKGPGESKVEFETDKDFVSGQRAALHQPTEVHVKRGKGIDYTQTGECTVVPELERPLMTVLNRFISQQIQELKRYHEWEN